MNICNEVEFIIRDHLSEDLATRNRASQFFELMESSRADMIVVNFEKVQSISRSFADEYVKRKKASMMAVCEKNVPINIQKMLEIVSAPVEKKQIVNFEKLKIGLL